jgi:hypothetical protein
MTTLHACVELMDWGELEDNVCVNDRRVQQYVSLLIHYDVLFSGVVTDAFGGT